MFPAQWSWRINFSKHNAKTYPGPSRMIKKNNFFTSLVSAFSISVITQGVGLLRQIFIAAYFGISKKLDIYFMAFAMVTAMVFTFAVAFDSVSIPHLVKTLEKDGRDVFKKLTGSIFTFSLLFSVALNVVFIVAIPVVIKLMAAGFSSENKVELASMALYFIPWTMIFMPYYALCSFYKSVRRFNIVFFGEFIISAVSLVFIIAFHPGTTSIPLAYFAGYLSAFTVLFAFSFKEFNRIGRVLSGQMKGLYRNFIELFGANQIGSVSTIVDRFFQSFLSAGSISVLSYSAQITANLSGLLSFRDIFSVPFSSLRERSEKLERVILGLTVITIPVMLFLSFYSREVIGILFMRGKFDLKATDLMASVFSLYVLCLVPGVIGTPGFRMFQIIDKIKNTGIIYLFSILTTIAAAVLFVFYLKLGIYGMVLTTIISSYLPHILSFFLLRMNGIRPDFVKVARYAAYSFFISSMMIVIVRFWNISVINTTVTFFIKTLSYFLLVAIAYLPIRQRLFGIITGSGSGVVETKDIA